MKTAIHRRLDKFCSHRVQTGRTQNFVFRLASRLEALLRNGKSTWRYGVKQELNIALQNTERPERKQKRKKVPKLLRRVRTMQGDCSGAK